jgi:hypothetical protein
MFVGDVGDLQKELTELSLQLALEHYQISLDFSHASINDVENILSSLHEKYAADGDEEGLHGIGLEFGFYIAATIQKNTNSGQIEKDHPSIGENTFPFNWNGKSIFPCAWCENRIYDGSGDDVSVKYQTLVLNEIK